MTAARTYDLVVGTGGIGTGMFLALEGDHTLGREESRAARLLGQKDYCKLHIVTHYVQTLLGPSFPVVPIGRVGDDEAGRRLRSEMATAGLDLTHVGETDRPTLLSVCFLYPGGDGGNLTTADSASDAVSPEDVARAAGCFAQYRGRGVALALPEVPLRTREALLTQATEHDFLRVATFVPGELQQAWDSGLMRQVDLLALNLDEAAALAGVTAHDRAPESLISSVVERLATVGAQPHVVVTAGSRGSWAWDGARLTHAPALKVEAVGTAGAGDAHLAGVVVALVRGLDLHAANRFGALLSGLKVTSRDSINFAITGPTLAATAQEQDMLLPATLRDLLVEPERRLR